jgi:Omp85 superfamily domain
MQRIRTAIFAGLCVHAACAQPEYSVNFRVIAGKLAVDHDEFHVVAALAKFEPAIRSAARHAIAKLPPLSPGLLIDGAWPDYASAYEKWAEADPSRLDLGTLFSASFLFTDLLKQTPDSGLVLNEDEIDPLDGVISFSILPTFDSGAVRIELPAMLESRRRTRIPQLRKRLARLNGALWSSADIRKALAPLYTNLGLAPQVLLQPSSGTIQIIEGPRIASLVLPADQVPAPDLDRLLWELLGTSKFQKARAIRSVDFNRDLGYASGDEPYAIQYQLQAMQLLISPLGYSLTAVPSARTGASQYVDLLVQSKTKANKSRHVGAGFEYKPGQGLSAIGNLELPPLTFSGGGPSGILGSGTYSAECLGFSAAVNAGVSVERNRVLDGIKVNEQSTTEAAILGWELWRDPDESTLVLQLDPSHAMVFNQTLDTIEPGVEFAHNNATSEYPWRVAIRPRVLVDLHFAHSVLTANTHRSFDHWEYDFSGRFENAFGHSPIFQLPSFGGADTVRGFRADDAIGRRLWADQNELWHPLPHWPALKVATFADLGGAYQTIGSYPGLRAGMGTGLRLDLRVAVLKFDWAYGFGHAATGGSRGKFYFNVTLPTH